MSPAVAPAQALPEYTEEDKQLFGKVALAAQAEKFNFGGHDVYATNTGGQANTVCHAYKKTNNAVYFTGGRTAKGEFINPFQRDAQGNISHGSVDPNLKVDKDAIIKLLQLRDDGAGGFTRQGYDGIKYFIKETKNGTCVHVPTGRVWDNLGRERPVAEQFFVGGAWVLASSADGKKLKEELSAPPPAPPPTPILPPLPNSTTSSIDPYKSTILAYRTKETEKSALLPTTRESNNHNASTFMALSIPPVLAAATEFVRNKIGHMGSHLPAEEAMGLFALHKENLLGNERARQKESQRQLESQREAEKRRRVEQEELAAREEKGKRRKEEVV